MGGALQQLLLQIFWVIQVGVLLSGPPRDAAQRPETRGAQWGFNEGVLPQDVF